MTKQGKATKAITAEQVKEVARTGAPHPLLTVDQLVGMTSRKDWDGTLYELKGTAAYEIADTVNQNHAAPQALAAA